MLPRGFTGGAACFPGPLATALLLLGIGALAPAQAQTSSQVPIHPPTTIFRADDVRHALAAPGASLGSLTQTTEAGKPAQPGKPGQNSPPVDSAMAERLIEQATKNPALLKSMARIAERATQNLPADKLPFNPNQVDPSLQRLAERLSDNESFRRLLEDPEMQEVIAKMQQRLGPTPTPNASGKQPSTPGMAEGSNNLGANGGSSAASGGQEGWTQHLQNRMQGKSSPPAAEVIQPSNAPQAASPLTNTLEARQHDLRMLEAARALRDQGGSAANSPWLRDTIKRLENRVAARGEPTSASAWNPLNQLPRFSAPRLQEGATQRWSQWLGDWNRTPRGRTPLGEGWLPANKIFTWLPEIPKLPSLPRLHVSLPTLPALPGARVTDLGGAAQAAGSAAGQGVSIMMPVLGASLTILLAVGLLAGRRLQGNPNNPANVARLLWKRDPHATPRWQILRSFENLALHRLGQAALWQNHKALAGQLALVAPAPVGNPAVNQTATAAQPSAARSRAESNDIHAAPPVGDQADQAATAGTLVAKAFLLPADPAVQLAHLYEVARYAPPEEADQAIGQAEWQHAQALQARLEDRKGPPAPNG